MKRKGAKPGDPRRAIAYVRASTEDQTLTFDAQRAELAAYAAKHGITIVRIFDELATSGAAPLDKRPQVMAAVAELRKEGCGVLLVAKRDRLARDVLSAITLEALAAREGARIISAAGEGSELEGPQGALLRTIVDAVAQYERGLIAARTRAVLRMKKSRGECVGEVPYGFRNNGGKLVEEPAEQKVITYVLHMRQVGWTYEQIRQGCTKRGFRSRVGTEFQSTQIARICTREKPIAAA